MQQPSILVADDEPVVLTVIERVLNSEPWSVEYARDGQEALDLLSDKCFDVAVLDLKMPNLEGMQVLQAMQKGGIETDVLILTGYGTVSGAVLAMKEGAQDFLTKPLDVDEFKNAIKRLLAKRYPTQHALAERLDAFLKANSSDSELTLGEVCKNFRISRRYASKLFKDNVGTTFRRRLAYYRVRKAKALIRASDEPLYRIAEDSGFKNYRQLTSAFQRLEGRSPREFRRPI